MRKGFWMVLAVALVAVLAAPASAGTDINGFYRAKAVATNFDGPAPYTIKNDMPTGGYLEQRIRMRFAFGEENVKVVAFFEIDFGSWGDGAGGTPVTVAGIDNVSGTGGSSNAYTSYYTGGALRNSGGALGGDRINLETKNVYVWFKVPNTSLDFTVGLQNQTDTIQGLFYGAADFAAIFATGKYEPVTWKLGWAKLYENDTQSWDDMNMVVAYANFSPTKDLKLGLGFYMIQDDTAKVTVSSATQLPCVGIRPSATGAVAYSTTSACGVNPALNGEMRFIGGTALDNAVGTNTKQIYTIPVDFTYNAGSVALSGFALYQFGTVDFTGTASSRKDIDISAFAADLRVDANVGPGKLFVEGLVLGGGDNSGNKYQSMVTLSDLNASPGGNSNFNRLDYQLLMSNPDDINQNSCLLGCALAAPSPNSKNNSSPGNGGRGMWTIGAGYTMKAMEKTMVKIGGGYLAAVKKLQSDPQTGFDTDMGMELNATVNYNIMKGLDFGVGAAYAWLGDFYKGTTTTGASANNNPDDIWTFNMRLNYAF